MGAPTALHEQRVAELETLAVLAGFAAPFALPWGLRPDVIRCCRARRSIFLGDAKETESPGCAATLARLRWYAYGLAVLTPPVREVTFALALPRGSSPQPWDSLLLSAIRDHVVFAGEPTTTSIGETAVVALRAAVLRRRPS